MPPWMMGCCYAKQLGNACLHGGDEGRRIDLDELAVTMVVAARRPHRAARQSAPVRRADVNALPRHRRRKAPVHPARRAQRRQEDQNRRRSAGRPEKARVEAVPVGRGDGYCFSRIHVA
jgi:hypothetical protein